MIKEYIEREALLKEEQEIYHWNGTNDVYGDFISSEIVRTFPAADVKPVVHGMWRVIHQTINPFGVELECSNCEQRTIFGNTSAKFCPNCGADMRGVH